MEDEARDERLRQVLADAGLDPGLGLGLGLAGDAVPLPSYSNDTWRIGSYVLRICWQGDARRLEREAVLARCAPSAVRYPALIDAGRTGELTWTVTRWIEGVPLAEAWPRLGERDRREAVDQLAQALAALHQWSPRGLPAGLLDRHQDPVDLSDSVSVVGATLHPLPLNRAVALAEHARALPFVTPHLIDAVLERLQDLAIHDPYREPAEHVVVHGDAHMSNVLWHDGDMAALLDLEWARLAPPDLELEPFLRAVDWSGWKSESMPVPEMAVVLGWLAESYPGLFAASNLLERLWLYQLTSTIRDLFTWPAAPAPADRLAPDHLLNLLPAFAKSSDHLERLLAM